MLRTRAARVLLVLGSATVLILGVTGAQASFPGADGKVVFVSTRDGALDWDITGEAEIYVMNANGSSQTRLTMTPGDDLDPVWSADGESIAFTSDRTGDLDIFVMDPDGSNQTQITDNPAADFQPAFSPHGNKIAFVSTRDGISEIYVYDGNGDTVTRLTTNAAEDHSPVWSPDGSKIAFVSDRDGDEEIWVMNAGGSAQTRLTNNTTPDYSPDWKPDNSKLVFISERDGVRPTPNDPVAGEIYVIYADGSGAVRMSVDTEYDNNPVFSNDSSEIAFTRSTMATPDEVYRMQESAGAERGALSNSAGYDFSPDYQPQ